MWIFNKDGFFSIVQKPNQIGTDFVTVRSRESKDLGNFLRSIKMVKNISKDIGTDYEFRIVVKKQDLRKYINNTINEMDYSNFKHEVELVDSGRAGVYLQIWAILSNSVRSIYGDIFYRKSKTQDYPPKKDRYFKHCLSKG